jgi:3-deoxy-D-manno-octulosonate 8-phosphate phosphatase (KDO 8-P phosphatase)
MKKKIKTKKNGIKCSNIKLLVLDVDGVMTDGSIIYDSQGNEYKIFNVQDGCGIELLRKKGIRVAFITGRSSSIVARRASELGVEDVFQGVSEKVSPLKELMDKYNLDSSEICAMGDDILDIPLLKMVGFPVTVKNARPEVKKIVKHITLVDGGKGAVREVAELILNG